MRKAYSKDTKKLLRYCISNGLKNYQCLINPTGDDIDMIVDYMNLYFAITPRKNEYTQYTLNILKAKSIKNCPRCKGNITGEFCDTCGTEITSN